MVIELAVTVAHLYAGETITPNKLNGGPYTDYHPATEVPVGT